MLENQLILIGRVDGHTSLLKLDWNSSNKTDSTKEHSSQSQDRRHGLSSFRYNRCCNKHNTTSQVQLLNSRVDKRFPGATTFTKQRIRLLQILLPQHRLFAFLSANPPRHSKLVVHTPVHAHKSGSPCFTFFDHTMFRHVSVPESQAMLKRKGACSAYDWHGTQMCRLLSGYLGRDARICRDLV